MTWSTYHFNTHILTGNANEIHTEQCIDMNIFISLMTSSYHLPSLANFFSALCADSGGQ